MPLFIASSSFFLYFCFEFLSIFRLSDLSIWFMIGITFDLTLITTLILTYKIKSLPLLLVSIFISVMVLKELAPYSRQYFPNSFIVQCFIGIVINRIAHNIKRINISDTISKSDTTPFSINYSKSKDAQSWAWTNRVKKLINKSARFIDIISLVIIPTAIFINYEAAPLIMLAYIVIWSLFLALIICPLILLERVTFHLIQKPEGVAEKKAKLKELHSNSKERIKAKSDDLRQWVKSGFDEDTSP